jgi:hypothetical protein
MKKSIALAATAVSLLVVGVAFAVTNTYSVTASTSPAKAGTKAKPVPISLSFNYTVGEATGQRPSSIKQYKIKFKGVKVNQKAVKKTCTADQINTAGNASGCPAAGIVGTGNVDNFLGPTSDPSNKSLHCYLALTLYNSKPGHVTLSLVGRKANPAPHDCITDIDTAIDGQYVVKNGFSILQFSVPPALLHPVPGLDNAVVNVTSKINKTATSTVAGKKLAYYNVIGGCVAHKRPVEVEFVSENNVSSTAKTTAKC